MAISIANSTTLCPFLRPWLITAGSCLLDLNKNERALYSRAHKYAHAIQRWNVTEETLSFKKFSMHPWRMHFIFSPNIKITLF
jgi:hypothetical protein